MNLVKLAQNSGMSGDEIAKLLKIANGHLPRIKYEYDRLQAELNSLKVEISNSVRIYQQFCDRNIALKNREDELLHATSELKNKKNELEKIITELNQHVSELRENETDNTILNPEVKHEGTTSTNDVLLSHPNLANHHHQNESYEIHHH